MKILKKGILIVSIISILGIFFFSSYFYFLPIPKPRLLIPAKQPLTELGEVWTQEDQQNSYKILAIIENILMKDTHDGSIMRRNVHPKAQGCVKSHILIDESALPEEQKVGIFARNTPKKYDAWIRFSGSDPNPNKHDADGNVRGMAIKFMNVKGSTVGSLDLLLINLKVFFVKDTAGYVTLQQGLSHGKLGVWGYLLTHPKVVNIIWGAYRMMVGNPLHIDYYSGTPYKLGNRAIKYSALTCTPPALRDKVPEKPPAHFLRENMIKTLKSGEVCFNLFVQINNDPSKFPIEDPTVEWDEKIAPYVKVGRIIIPKQNEIDSPQRMAFCENLSFDPWHTIPEQRPLGSVNRVRLDVYQAISKMRHEYNHIPQIEPKNLEACTGDTAILCH